MARPRAASSRMEPRLMSGEDRRRTIRSPPGGERAARLHRSEAHQGDPSRSKRRAQRFDHRCSSTSWRIDGVGWPRQFQSDGQPGVWPASSLASNMAARNMSRTSALLRCGIELRLGVARLLHHRQAALVGLFEAGVLQRPGPLSAQLGVDVRKAAPARQRGSPARAAQAVVDGDHVGWHLRAASRASRRSRHRWPYRRPSTRGLARLARLARRRQSIASNQRGRV